MTSPAELQSEMIRLSRHLDTAQAELVKQSIAWATAVRDYRKAKSVAYAAIRNEKLLAGDREAQVDAAVADLEYTKNLSESLKQAASNGVQNGRSQLSALQSVASSVRAEMEMSRYGPAA